MNGHLDGFIKELLHTDDVRGNRLINVGDIGCNGEVGKAFLLCAQYGENCKTALNVIRARRGKPSNKTILDKSALVRSTMNSPAIEKWTWSDLAGNTDPKALDKFISEVYGAIDLKGNNPLFLGVGILKWQTAAGDGIKTVNSPLLVFPIRLIRGSGTGPVEIEFVDDDAFFNPCLIHKLRTDFSESVAAGFPHPNGPGADFDDPIDLDMLGDGETYMRLAEEYVRSLDPHDTCGAAELDKNMLTIARFSHGDICMYYDVRRNMRKIYGSPLVARVFGTGGIAERGKYFTGDLKLVLPSDSVQENIIRKIAGGSSLIVKGPPGTGKTLTIANIVSALTAQGKKVLVVSEKISALSEVYAKIPERIRKFVMLMDYETEQKAAAVDPAAVRADFKKLLNERRKYVYDPKNDAEYAAAERARTEAALFLADHAEQMFGGGVAFGSYYDALDAYCKNSLPVIRFADSGDIASVSGEDYGKLLLNVEKAAEYYKKIICGGSVTDCPWSGISEKTDAERAFAALSDISDKLKNVCGAVRGVCPDSAINVTLSNISDAAVAAVLSDGDVNKAVAVLHGDDGVKLAEAFERCKALHTDAEMPDIEIDAEAAVSVDWRTFESIACFEYADIKCVAENASIFDDANVGSSEYAEEFYKAVRKLSDLTEERKKLVPTVLYAFDMIELGECRDMEKSADALKKYTDGKKTAPGFFDIKARSTVKKLRKFCSRTDITLKELAQAAEACRRISECDGAIKALTGVVSHIAGRNGLSDGEIKAVTFAAENSHGDGIGFAELCKKAVEITEKIVASEIKNGISFGDIATAVKDRVALSAFLKIFTELCGKCGIDTGASAKEQYERAEAFSAVSRIVRSQAFGGGATDAATFICGLRKTAASAARSAEAAVGGLYGFGAAFFGNGFTETPWDITVGRAKAFIAQSGDRAVLNAALMYAKIKYGKDNVLPLDAFFAPIERGETVAAADDIPKIFERSFIAAAIEHKLKELGTKRNGLGKNAELAAMRFSEAERMLCECNVLKTENLCMARIDPDDPDFDFLSADRGIPMSLRVMFRLYAKAILKLKRCIILSPSTASVLFRGEAYEDFDTAVVDETSQMEPVDLLPILFRTKQCVLVGDEFQMPPITHFKVKNRKRIADPDSVLTPDPDISALSLALGNTAFETCELACHYRSKTETLIAFSQREFYPYMRTFPATDPATDELGFRDIHTENGYCEDGVNSAEAEAVVKALDGHFCKYFDEKTGMLSSSVGVVTFGEAQLKYVTELVRKNTALNKKIDRAYANFDDVPDKLVFFRTIENVQGQETDNLILSLTYGRDKDGKIKTSFGELNRDATGKNIFNVAVTRAKNSVTVIHSVTPEEISGNPRIAFIREYLTDARRFAENGKGQFVTGAVGKGANFIADVTRAVAALGVDNSRIVVNYGVTEGSVRIPVAVLSKDLTRAELGLWCELPTLKNYDFIDYNIRYVNTLVERGWNIHRIYPHDWLDNAAYERAALKAAVDKYVSK